MPSTRAWIWPDSGDSSGKAVSTGTSTRDIRNAPSAGPPSNDMIPELGRVAIHQAGHAVVQALVGRQRFAVARVSLDGPHGSTWRGQPASGEALLDREVFLSLYEFGLVTLAGVAAEERYLQQLPPEDEPVVAISDLTEWQEAALPVLETSARFDMVSRNLMRHLEETLATPAIWQVVELLAGELMNRGTVAGNDLQRILAQLPTLSREA